MLCGGCYNVGIYLNILDSREVNENENVPAVEKNRCHFNDRVFAKRHRSAARTCFGRSADVLPTIMERPSKNNSRARAAESSLQTRIAYAFSSIVARVPRAI